MSEVNINYKGSKIAGMDASGTKTLQTQGKYCEGNIEVEYTRPSGGQPNLQTKSKTYTPTETAQSEAVEADNGYDGLERVNVSVGAIDSEYVGSDVPRKSSSDLTASGATVNAPAGYYPNGASKAVSAGSEGTPTAQKGSVSNHKIAVTPKVTNGAGYIAGGEKTGNAVEVSASELVSGTKQITDNGTDIDVTNYEKVDVAVPTGGGSSKNAQTAQSTSRATSSSYTKVISLTCEKSGTYDVYWSTFRSSTSGTWGSQLYIDNSAHGSAITSGWSNHIQNNHLTGVQIEAGEEVAVRVRSRGSNYYGYVGTLTIIEA